MTLLPLGVLLKNMIEISNGYLTMPPVAIHLELIQISTSCNNYWCSWSVFFKQLLGVKRTS